MKCFFRTHQCNQVCQSYLTFLSLNKLHLWSSVYLKIFQHLRVRSGDKKLPFMTLRGASLSDKKYGNCDVVNKVIRWVPRRSRIMTLSLLQGIVLCVRYAQCRHLTYQINNVLAPCFGTLLCVPIYRAFGYDSQHSALIKLSHLA